MVAIVRIGGQCNGFPFGITAGPAHRPSVALHRSGNRVTPHQFDILPVVGRHQRIIGGTQPDPVMLAQRHIGRNRDWQAAAKVGREPPDFARRSKRARGIRQLGNHLVGIDRMGIRAHRPGDTEINRGSLRPVPHIEAQHRQVRDAQRRLIDKQYIVHIDRGCPAARRGIGGYRNQAIPGILAAAALPAERHAESNPAIGLGRIDRGHRHHLVVIGAGILHIVVVMDDSPDLSLVGSAVRTISDPDHHRVGHHRERQVEARRSPVGEIMVGSVRGRCRTHVDAPGRHVPVGIDSYHFRGIHLQIIRTRSAGTASVLPVQTLGLSHIHQASCRLGRHERVPASRLHILRTQIIVILKTPVGQLLRPVQVFLRMKRRSEADKPHAGQSQGRPFQFPEKNCHKTVFHCLGFHCILLHFRIRP